MQKRNYVSKYLNICTVVSCCSLKWRCPTNHTSRAVIQSEAFIASLSFDLMTRTRTD